MNAEKNRADRMRHLMDEVDAIRKYDPEYAWAWCSALGYCM